MQQRAVLASPVLGQTGAWHLVPTKVALPLMPLPSMHESCLRHCRRRGGGCSAGEGAAAAAAAAGPSAARCTLDALGRDAASLARKYRGAEPNPDCARFTVALPSIGNVRGRVLGFGADPSRGPVGGLTSLPTCLLTVAEEAMSPKPADGPGAALAAAAAAAAVAAAAAAPARADDAAIVAAGAAMMVPISGTGGGRRHSENGLGRGVERASVERWFADLDQDGSGTLTKRGLLFVLFQRKDLQQVLLLLCPPSLREDLEVDAEGLDGRGSEAYRIRNILRHLFRQRMPSIDLEVFVQRFREAGLLRELPTAAMTSCMHVLSIRH